LLPILRISGGKAPDVVVTCREATAKTLPNGPSVRVADDDGFVLRRLI